MNDGYEGVWDSSQPINKPKIIYRFLKKRKEEKSKCG